ncbi:hypothetical protein ABW20_dc0109525 [Dactylellina cionopaga]|nr:hypothetical protein ABW20_dc0109525 [Dactylellina cionopaga]
MKSFIQTIVLGMWAVGTSAQYTSVTPPAYSASTATSAAPASTTSAVTCPAAFDAACPFVCGFGTNSQYSCFPGFDSHMIDCKICPGVPSTCPATYAASCAFICEASGTKFCNTHNLFSGASDTVGACKACPGVPSGNSTTPVVPPTSPTGNGTTVTPTEPPKPTYSSGASALSMGSAVVFGFLCIAFVF